jgi:hypothetical protein
MDRATLDPMAHAFGVEHVTASQAPSPLLLATNRSHMIHALMMCCLRQRSYTAQWIQIVSKAAELDRSIDSYCSDDTSTRAELQPLDRFHNGADGGPLGRIQTTCYMWIDAMVLGQHVVPTYRTNVGWQCWRHRCNGTNGTMVEASPTKAVLNRSIRQNTD